MNIDKKALKGVVDEIEASRARQKGETEFQREALKRAVKNHQLDAKAIRIVLQRRAMGDTKRDEQDYYVHSYEAALGGKRDALEALEKGASIREAAKAGGISTGAAAALAKSVQESSFVNDGQPHSDSGAVAGDETVAPATPDHDPDTGEITQSAVPETPPGEGTGTTAASGPGSALASNPDQPSIMPAPTVWHEVTVVWQAAEAERKAARAAERERRRAAHAELAAKNAAIDADPLIPPPHLDRRQKVAA